MLSATPPSNHLPDPIAELAMSRLQLSLSQTGAVESADFTGFVERLQQANSEGLLEIAGTPTRTYLISWRGGGYGRFSVQRESDHASAVARFVSALVDLFSRQSFETRASRLERNFNRIGAVTTSTILEGIASHRVRGASDREVAAVHERRDRLALVDHEERASLEHYFNHLEGCDLAQFRRKNLRDMDFSGLFLDEHDFSGADLRGASFRDAELNGANFSGADLRGADFLGASLAGANLHQAQMEDVTIEPYQVNAARTGLN
jgi:Pentapeptide repeats (8 copies)